MKYALLLSASLFFSPDEELLTPFEKSDGNYTATYEETIAYYKQLDDQFNDIKGANALVLAVTPMPGSVMSMNPIPEPSALQIFAVGALVVAAGIRRNTRQPGSPLPNSFT